MLNSFTSYLGSKVTPGEASNELWSLIYILIIFAGVSVAVIAMNWLERKILAHIQVRLGPMRVGPHGLLQPIADALKLLLKEDIIPAEADKVVFWIAPLFVVITAFTVFMVVPFGPSHAVTDMNIGVLFMLGVSSLSVLGVVMAGWASNSHYPLIGRCVPARRWFPTKLPWAWRWSRRAYDQPERQGTGTLSMIDIVKAQQAQHVWFLFKFFPLGLIAFVIFAIAMVAETNRAPFDLAEAESELTAGFHTEYSGLRWSLFMLAEYAAMIAVSSIAVTLWLGGWMHPFPESAERAGMGIHLLAFSGTNVPRPGRDRISWAQRACRRTRFSEFSGLGLPSSLRCWDSLRCSCSSSPSLDVTPTPASPPISAKASTTCTGSC